MTGKVITVFNQKGGCGKTTVTMHLGGSLALRKRRVLIVDMDPQGTSTRWAANASDDKPFPASVISLSQMGGKMHRELRKHVENYDYVVIDCPPSIDSPVPSSALLVSDLAVIPTVLSPGDIWAIVEAKKLVAAAQEINEGLQVRVVANMVQKTAMAKYALASLEEDTEMPLMESKLALRSGYRECQAIGATVHSVPRAGDAVKETEAFVTEVEKTLKGAR